MPNRRQESPYPMPDKLSLGDDSSVWEAKTKRYIQRFPADEQVDLILTLLSKEVFSKLLDHGVPQDVNSLFALLRQIADSPVAEVDRQNEFYVRTQEEGERLVEYLSVLRRLDRLGFPEEAREDRESRILSRFLAGVRDPMAKVFLRLQPPKDLATLESTSTTLDQTGDGMNVTNAGGGRYFTTLDLASGYWQIEVEPEDREKAAFAIPSGLYEFQTMPFGLTNAPATFQRLMNHVLEGLIPSKCLAYIDDVLIHGKTVEEHLTNLELVLKRIKEARLKSNPTKCRLSEGKSASWVT
ncbi:Retrovirus Pol polyprotein from transposon 17.6 [Fasciola gigantica]|uniref:Retrovirus Pol polyprotein from transposon 17.6 n=1 Tax=Fasciola gigantica TaxID=46835 RepID=A0A504YUY7_FASGI|nr:Retrovirus Pol polyprotein from transposon 17.6 [Fasciola gigantica]